MTSIGFNISGSSNYDPCPYIDLGRVAGRNLASDGKATLVMPLRAGSYTVLAGPDVTQIKYGGVASPMIDGAAQFIARPDTPQLNIIGPDPMNARVSIVPTALVANHKAGEVFLPEAVKWLSIASTLRFMDSARTNPSDFTVWPTPDALTLNEKAMPIEHMVALCIATDADMKLCIPYKLPDAEILWVIRLARSLLPSRLKLSVEWSNEVWNMAAGFRAGREAAGKDGFVATCPSYEFYGRGSAALNKLIAQVPGVTQDLAWQWVAGVDGLKRVVGSFIANGGNIGLVSALNNAPYIRIEGDWTGKSDAEIIAGLASNEAAESHILGEVADYCQSLGKAFDLYEINYEVGKRRSSVVTQAAADLLERRLREFERVGGNVACLYRDVGSRTIYGIGADYGDAGGDMRRPMIEKLAAEWARPNIGDVLAKFGEVSVQFEELKALVVRLAA